MMISISLLLLQSVPAFLMRPIPNDSVRVSHQPVYVAPDGSRSTIGPRVPTPGATETALLAREGDTVVVTDVFDDAGGCGAPHSVYHWLTHDTLSIVTFSDTPQICVAEYTPARHRVTVAGLAPGSYVVRVFREGRGGRNGPGATAKPGFVDDIAIP